MDHQAIAQLLGNYGEFVGAIAVVVTLAYLAVQIRNQNRESRIASVHEIVSAHRGYLASLNDGETAEIFVKAANSFDSLSDVERLRYVQVCMHMLKLGEEAYYQLKQGRLEDYIWQGMMTQMGEYLSLNCAKEVWRLRRHQFGADYQAFVDSIESNEYRI
jgi:hypothetical protein